MAQARWTRESAINYLANNPDFTPTKPFTGEGSYSTPYLKRAASAYQDAEQAGRRAPTTQERRGHARAKPEHLPKEGHRLDQYRVLTPPDRDLEQADLLNLYRRAKRGAAKSLSDEVMVAITGVVNYIPVRGSIPANNIQTLSFWTDMESLQEMIKDMEDIFQFAEEISGLQWEEILAVSFAFPNEKK